MDRVFLLWMGFLWGSALFLWWNYWIVWVLGLVLIFMLIRQSLGWGLVSILAGIIIQAVAWTNLAGIPSGLPQKEAQFKVREERPSRFGSLVQIQEINRGPVSKSIYAYQSHALKSHQECHGSGKLQPLSASETSDWKSMELRRAQQNLIGRIKWSKVACEEASQKESWFQRLQRSVDAGPPSLRAFKKAMLLGDQAAIPQSWWSFFNYTGLSHLIVISGSHLSLFIILFASAFGFLLGRVYFRQAPWVFRITLFLKLIFLLLFWQSGIPLVRAAIAFSVSHFLSLVWPALTRYRGSQILAGVGILLGAVYPLDIFTRSYVFSFVATWTLLKAIEEPGISLNVLQLSARVFVPIFLAGFFWHQFSSPLSALFNVTFGTFFISLICPLLVVSWCTSYFDSAIEKLCNFFVGTVEFAAHATAFWLPPLSLRPTSAVLLLVAWLVFSLWAHRIPPNLRRIVWWGGLVVILVAAAWPPSRSAEPSGVYAVDVGQGDGFLLKLDDSWVVIDGGEKQRFLDFVLEKTGGKVDVWVLTHFDKDHAHLLLESSWKLKIKEIWVPWIDGSKTGRALRKTGIKIQQVRQEQASYFSRRFELKGFLVNSRGKSVKNKNSIILALKSRKHNRITSLFLGDISSREEERLLLSELNLRDLSLLKVGHHGSRLSSSEEFISRLSPKMALVSAGRHNSYGHPDSSVLDRLQRWNVRLESTLALGSFFVSFDP